MAITNLKFKSTDRVDYLEEVYHVALSRPEIARGVIGVTADGRLLKDQRLPRREISKIGDAFISVSKTPEGPGNLLLIPRELRPMLDAMRLMVTGDIKAIVEAFTLDLLPEGSGWRIKLVPRNAAAAKAQIALTGCGALLHAIEIEQGNGIRRIMTLERPQ